jgi:mannose/fructose/sorbose-specific phosphotransferase system IIA component
LTKKANDTRLPGIVIMTHGPLAEALIKSASMLFGEMTDVLPLGLEEGEAPETYYQRLIEGLKTLREDPLFLLDFVGGTPFNTLIQYAKDHHVNALSGVNIPILLEAAHQRDDLSGADLLEAVSQAGDEGTVDLTEMIKEAKTGGTE